MRGDDHVVQPCQVPRHACPQSPHSAARRRGTAGAGKVHKIGFLYMSSATAVARNFEAFQQGLRELGSIEGQDLVIGMERGEGSTMRSHKTHIGTLG
jgi:hypothetical protein